MHGWRNAAAAVATALVLSACSGGGHVSTSAGTDLDSFRCPDPHATITPTPGRSLPPGATAALICYSADEPVAWRAPDDVLTRHVDHLVAFVNRRPVHPTTEFCNTDAGPAYRIVLDYPDGARVITGDRAGCRDVRVGTDDREGGRGVWHTFFTLLARQREHSKPGRAPRAQLSCPTPRHPGSFTPLWDGTLTSARFCPSRTAQHPRATHGIPMSGRDLAVLRHDLATSADRRQRHPLRPGRCRGGLHVGYDVVAVDRWSDVIDIRGACSVYLVVVPGTDRVAYVRALPATVRMLARLAEAR
jgi:hypothetical protein